MMMMMIMIRRYIYIYSTGKICMKPSFSRTIQPGDEIIVLAEDNDTYKASAQPIDIPDSVSIMTRHPLPTPPKKILLCGWRRNITTVLMLLDHLSAPETEVTLANRQPVEKRSALLQQEGLDVHNGLMNIHLKHVYANMAIRRYVDGLPITEYDCIMVMSDENETTPLGSDSNVLASVLMLRGVELAKRSNFSIRRFSSLDIRTFKREKLDLLKHNDRVHCIAEMLDPRTQKTIASNRTIALSSDYIMSNRLISRMLAMISENRYVNVILADLLGAKGNMFDVLPAQRYATVFHHHSHTHTHYIYACMCEP